MEKIIFEDLPSTKTPINASNLNKIQENVGNVINDLNKNLDEEIIKVNNKFNYSTEEQKIGTWIDGKPIYRTVFNYGALPNNTISGSVSKEHGINNIDNITNIYGIAYNSDNNFRTLPYVNVWELGEGVTIEATRSAIVTKTNSNQSSYIAYITLEYTKTTD